MHIHLIFENNRDHLIVDLAIPPVVGDNIELVFDPDEPMPDWIIECDSDLWKKICEDGLVVTSRRLYEKDKMPICVYALSIKQ